MPLGQRAAAPVGYLDFCLRRPDQCGLGSPMTPADYAALAGERAFAYNDAKALISPSSTATVQHLSLSPPSAADERSEPVGLFLTSEDADQRPLDLLEEFGRAPPADSAVPVMARDLVAQTWTGNALGYGRLFLASYRPGFTRQLDGGGGLVPLRSWMLPAIATERFEARALPESTVQRPPKTERNLILTQALWDKMIAVDQAINDKIKPMSDEQAFGVSNYWTLPLTDGPKAVGNCKHYALEKRKALVDLGFPAAALSLAVVKTRGGEIHAVLLVMTDQGEYVLDNLSPWVTPWTQSDYVWLTRQTPGEPLHWVTPDIQGRTTG